MMLLNNYTTASRAHGMELERLYIKRLLRQLERHDKAYAIGTRSVFDAITSHYAVWAPKIGSKVKIETFIFHYVPSQGEKGHESGQVMLRNWEKCLNLSVSGPWKTVRMEETPGVVLSSKKKV